MSTRELALRDYQEAILDKLRAAFIEGHKHVVLVAPTGAGKTEMAMALLGASADRGKRAAMVLDRVVLCNQTSARLDTYGMDHGVLQAGHWRFRPSANGWKIYIAWPHSSSSGSAIDRGKGLELSPTRRWRYFAGMTGRGTCASLKTPSNTR